MKDSNVYGNFPTPLPTLEVSMGNPSHLGSCRDYGGYNSSTHCQLYEKSSMLGELLRGGRNTFCVVVCWKIHKALLQSAADVVNPVIGEGCGSRVKTVRWGGSPPQGGRGDASRGEPIAADAGRYNLRREATDEVNGVKPLFPEELWR